MIHYKRFLFSVILAGCVFSIYSLDSLAAVPELSKGQLVYVPAYSHIYSGDNESRMLMAVTLSIRNTDIKYPMKIVSVDYYDSHGKLLKRYVKKTVTLGPMGSTRYVVKYNDTSGGSGANFIVRWSADRGINLPIVESIMIGAQSQEGISFTSRGQAIKEH